MFRPEYDQRRRFNWILIFAALVMLLLFGTGSKPPLERIFGEDPPGEGLALENIGFTREPADNGAGTPGKLIVRGTVRNNATFPKTIPGIQVSLLDKDDETLASQMLASMSRVLEPDETADFFTAFEPPPKGAKRINVTFEER
ncbi:MAG: DUF3426 domain-containing protein [Magnetovibrionaceae bacterium]